MHLRIRGNAQWAGRVTEDGYLTAYGAIGYTPVQVGNVTLYRLFTEINPDCAKCRCIPIEYKIKDKDPYITKKQLDSLKIQLQSLFCTEVQLANIPFSEEELEAFDKLIATPPDFSKYSIELLVDLR